MNDYLLWEVALSPLSDDEIGRLQRSDRHGLTDTATVMLVLDDESAGRNLVSRRCLVADLMCEAFGKEVYGFAECGAVTV